MSGTVRFAIVVTVAFVCGVAHPMVLTSVNEGRPTSAVPTWSACHEAVFGLGHVTGPEERFKSLQTWPCVAQLVRPLAPPEPRTNALSPLASRRWTADTPPHPVQRC